MIRERDRVLTAVWNSRDKDLPIETQDQLVTLASIVEKETGMADERSRVAAVFINRIKQNMRLQSDPTVIYGVYGGAGLPSGASITKADLDAENDYNTYKIAGLPKGPIAQSGQGLAGRGRQSVAHEGSLFRRRRHGWALLLGDVSGASQERRALPPGAGEAEGGRHCDGGRSPAARAMRSDEDPAAAGQDPAAESPADATDGSAANDTAGYDVPAKPEPSPGTPTPKRKPNAG